MKLPFIQFFPSDYMRDTRALSLAAKGGWVDVMCMLHGSSTRGTMTLPVVGWARVMGATVDQSAAVIDELDAMKVAEVIRTGNGDVTISSRRMLRDAITREQTRLRVRSYRRNTHCNGGSNGDVTGQKSEARSQKPETIVNPIPLAELAVPASASSNGELPLGPVGTNPATDPIVMTFPTSGKMMKEWPLRESKVAEWRAAYPAVNVDDVIRELRQWCIDNPKRRKTPHGMNAFLSGRLAVRQDRARPGDGTTKRKGEFNDAW